MYLDMLISTHCKWPSKLNSEQNEPGRKSGLLLAWNVLSKQRNLSLPTAGVGWGPAEALTTVFTFLRREYRLGREIEFNELPLDAAARGR